MKKEYLLMMGSVSFTILIALAIIRWFAPQLLGISNDLQLVQIDKKVPPFFESVFRRNDFAAKEFILKDPLTRVRAKPLFPNLYGMGPNDLLGFRNHNIPNEADIITIGDSQTYGNNAPIDKNWPNQFQSLLKKDKRMLRTYSMAVGGWGAIQYLDMFPKSTVFKPRAIIVAFYTGNDPLESFLFTYGSSYWKELIPNKDLTQKDIPDVTFPSPKSEQWSVEFKDNTKTIFTPTMRLASNQDHPAVKAGYDIMQEVARRIVDIANSTDIKVLFTIIPTKELVFAQKVKQDRLMPPSDYTELVTREAMNIEQLARAIKEIEGATYTDLVKPLQTAALNTNSLYPEDSNGHPVSGGYEIIASALKESINELLPRPETGLYAIQLEAKKYQYSLITHGGRWIFPDAKLIEANGWPAGEVKTVSLREVSGVPLLGIVNEVDPQRFGPCFHNQCESTKVKNKPVKPTDRNKG